MSAFLARLRQRKLVQWAVAYVAGAFALLQGIDIIAQQFGWPETVQRGITLALVLGFFVTLLLAWYHGERGVQKVSGVEVLLLALLLAIGGGLLWQFARAPQAREPAVATAPARQSSAAPAASTSSATAIPAKSIAVLAFRDLSPQHDKGYFSDGIAEELLNALARVRDLKVAGRTSSFRFKGQNESLRTIGNVLGVANVLEGSVRTQGDKVRITAQLVRTRDGFQLWSQAYDGSLKDVFAVQEKIARNITSQLQVVLSGRQSEQLVDVGTTNPQAYTLYLQATATFNRRDGAHFDEAMEQLRQAVALDPKFARAWSRMATLQAVRSNYVAGQFQESMRAAERYARKAISLDASLAEPHAALAMALTDQRQFRAARPEMAKALALEPNDVTTNFWHGVMLQMLGYRQRATAALDRALQLDPLLPNALLWRAGIHIADGELDVAARQLQRAAEGGLSFVGLSASRVDMARGQRAAATRSLGKALTYFTQGFPPAAAGVFARVCTGDASARPAAMDLIDHYVSTRPKVLAAIVPYVLLCAGDSERAFTLAELAPTNNDALLLSRLFADQWPGALRTPAFAQFARKSGLAAYWDEFGPPDFCRKFESDKYVCK